MNMKKVHRESPVRKALTAGQCQLVYRAVAVAALLTAAGVFHVASHGRAVQAGYALGKIEREHRALLRQHEQLKMERATLSSAARLESIAREQLGLALPTARQVVPLPQTPPRVAPADQGAAMAAVQRMPGAEAHP